MNTSPHGNKGQSPILLLMVVVLLAATALRVVASRDAPPGPRFDETYAAMFARRIMSGEHPIYFAENFGEEALNPYFQAASFTAFGWSDFALRFPSIAFGLIEVAAVYALGKRAWSTRAGLLAAALCAGSFWAIFYSRLGLRLMALPAFVSIGVLLLWRMQSARRNAWVWAGLAGVLLGLAAYTYTAARALPLLAGGVLVYLALTRRQMLRRQALSWLLVILISGLIAVPLVRYLVTHPQAENRVEQVAGPLEAMRAGNFGPLAEYVLRAAGMFAVRGDSEVLYNLPGRPVFDPITVVVFVIGLVVALSRWRASRTAFVLIWLGAGLMPIILSWPPASNSHAILAQPAVLLLAGLGLDVFLRWMTRVNTRARRPVWGVVPALGLAVVAINAGASVRDYIRWNADDSVRWEHQATVTAMGRYADAHTELRDIAFAGTAVDYQNPWMKVGNSLTSRRTDERWFNPARALVWNPAGPMMYLVPFRDPNPVTFNQIVREMFDETTALALDVKLPDGRPVMTGYEMRDASGLSASARAPGNEPYDFGGRWTWLGGEVRPAQAQPGDFIRVVTYWRVTRQEPGPLMMFVHLRGPDGKLVAQEDRLDVAPETLHAGDEFMQTHRLALAGNAPPGEYTIQVGLYSPVTEARVPVAGGDHLELKVTVK